MSKSISSKKNASMNNAKKAKKDDFYTPLSEIEAELSNYKEYFKDKVICLPCDESEHTNFFKHFMLNADEYQWKKLIAIGYRTNRNAEVHAVIVENGDEKEMNYSIIGNGDFRNQDTRELMASADIIVTNPPFSVFREFMATLIELDKKFIIVGNQNSVNCKEIFPLFQENKVWFGYGYNKVVEFNVRGDDYTYDRVDAEGLRWGKVPGICWMTNLPTKKREQVLDTEIDFEYGKKKGWYQQC